MNHIGIDVHKRESQIYILAEEGPAAQFGSASCHLVPLGAGEENLPDREHSVFYWGVPPQKKS